MTVEKDGVCYCGKDRNLNVYELLCGSCQRWFHENCISLQIGKVVPFLCNYTFTCKNCSTTGLESFKKAQATFPQICLTAIGNLMQNSVKEGGCRKMFNREKEIIPFIENHWESMTTMPRRVTQSWHATILRALTKETGTLFKAEERDDGTCYGLLGMELTQIRPPYDGMSKPGIRQSDGWTDNLSGPEIIYYAIGKGLIRCIGFSGDLTMCNCPGDITVRGLITSTWKVACYDKIMKTANDSSKSANVAVSNDTKAAAAITANVFMSPQLQDPAAPAEISYKKEAEPADSKTANVSRSKSANVDVSKAFSSTESKTANVLSSPEFLHPTSPTQTGISYMIETKPADSKTANVSMPFKTANVVNSNFFNPKMIDLCTAGSSALDDAPLPDILWREYFFFAPNSIAFWFGHMIFNALPIFLLSLAAMLARKRTPLNKATRTYYVFITLIFSKFISTNYDIVCENLKRNFDCLSESDKKVFDITVKQDKSSIRKMVVESCATLSRMTKERDLPLKVRLAQRKRMLLLDQIVRYILAVLFSYYAISYVLGKLL